MWDHKQMSIYYTSSTNFYSHRIKNVNFTVIVMSAIISKRRTTSLKFTISIEVIFSKPHDNYTAHALEKIKVIWTHYLCVVAGTQETQVFSSCNGEYFSSKLPIILR